MTNYEKSNEKNMRGIKREGDIIKLKDLHLLYHYSYFFFTFSK
jgi:hypothetical protein